MDEPKNENPTHSSKEGKDFRNNVTKILQTADREGLRKQKQEWG